MSERVSATGKVLKPLDEAAVEALVPVLEQQGIESVSIGFMHSYIRLAHEARARDILQARLPHLYITLSGEASPEIREFDRWSTACANAYVQPLMDRYLGKLETALRDRGIRGAMLMITSGGGLTALETARRFPIRLVESGPAGGAILAAHLSKECGLSSVLSFDMGGTTAKICLIDERRGRTAPASSRWLGNIAFSRAAGCRSAFRSSRWSRSAPAAARLAHVDALGRIHVGPESAGSEPGPACYGRGGDKPAVTDADLLLGRLDPKRFGDGALQLDPAAAATATLAAIGRPLGLDAREAAFGIVEVVEENMAARRPCPCGRARQRSSASAR